MIHPTVVIFGDKVKISDKARIDCFCVLSGDIEIGDYVHIACGVHMFGNEKIKIANFAGISGRCALYTASDDFTEGYLNGIAPMEYRKVRSGPIEIEEAAIIGTNSTILPNVKIGRGAAICAHSIINSDVRPYAILGKGKIVGYRNQDQLEKFMKEAMSLKKESNYSK